jgi:hypothetical protein
MERGRGEALCAGVMNAWWYCCGGQPGSLKKVPWLYRSQGA